MPQQRRTAVQQQTQQRSARRETRPAAAQALPWGLPPLLQLQRTMGNRQVAQLIQARRLAADGKVRGVQRQSETEEEETEPLQAKSAGALTERAAERGTDHSSMT